MNRLASLALGGALALGLAAPSAASGATTLGSTAIPTGSAPGCFAAVIAQKADNPSHPYFVPGPGTITSWSINTAFAGAGTPVTFVVLRPLGGGVYSVVGTDPRALPTPLPSGGVASYPLATPIAVAGGDTLGLYISAPTLACYYSGGSVPAASMLTALGSAGAPVAGQTLAPVGDSPPSHSMNLAASFEPQVPATKKKCKKGKKKKAKKRSDTGKSASGHAAKKKKKCKKKKRKKGKKKR